jgi:hypothetical protein
MALENLPRRSSLGVQSRAVLSVDADTTCVPSGENATDMTLPEWPSNIRGAVLQSSFTFGFVWIQPGIHFSNRLRIMLFIGVKTSAEQYI